MTELQGAVAWAQFAKLADVVETRVRLANCLTQLLADVPGIEPPRVTRDSVHTYWRYCLHVDAAKIPGGAVGLGRLLREHGIACAPRYIQKPAFQCEIFQKQRTFGNSRFPFTLARPEAVDYDVAGYPGAMAALAGVLVLPWNERFTDEHVQYIADSVRASVHKLLEH
jgi:dTDP-4-amino-4,6-dideoxygalactose transaminase